MHRWRKSTFLNKSVCWLVVVAVAMLSLVSLHRHLHSDDGVLAAPHAVEALSHPQQHISAFHAVSDTQGHDGHDDVIVLVTSDSLIKKVNIDPLFLVALIGIFVFSLIAPTPARLFSRLPRRFRKRYLSISPPLRAPPIH